MPAAPTSPLLDAIDRAAAQIVVLLGDDQGNWPTEADEVDYLTVTGISLQSGGQRLDTIQLRWDLARSGQRLIDTTTPVGHNRLIEVHRVDDDGNLIKLAWGRMSDQTHAIDGSRETINLTARVDWYLIGPQRLSEYPVRLPDDSKVMVSGAPTFNPVIKSHRNSPGRTQGNRAESTIDGSWVFQAWDSTQTTAAKTLFTTIPKRWTLPQAVSAMCWLLNPDEDYVLNPDDTELRNTLKVDDISDEELLRDVALKVGATLPEVLDDLLHHWGFDWHLQHADGPGQKSRIVAFKRSDGLKRQLYAVRPGDWITIPNTNLHQFQATWSIAGSANVVDALSSRYRIESTFLLVPGWLQADDAQLGTAPVTSPAGQQNAAVGHKWVLNEAGDYNGSRTGVDSLTDLSALLTDPHDGTRPPAVLRRRFLPCLTLAARPASTSQPHYGANGYLLEWLENPGSGTPRWQRVDWSFSVLEDECGIMLTGRGDPALERQVIDEGAVTGRAPIWKLLRLTCSIEGDTVIRAHAARRPLTSPNGLDVTSVLDLSDRWHHRRVLSSSVLYPQRHAASGWSIASDQSLVLPGNLTAMLKAGDTITIIDGGLNTGSYTLSADSSLLLGNTLVPLQETLPLTTGATGTVCWLTEEADDSRALEKLAILIRDENDHAEVGASVKLDGVDHSEYQIGDLIDRVAGRNLTLESLAPGTSDPRSLQIVGINYSLDGEQRMELLLESFRAEQAVFERRVSG